MKEEQQKKAQREREIIKSRAEINKIEFKMIQKINESKSWFLEKINDLDKLLTRLMKKKRERSQINKIRNEKEK